MACKPTWRKVLAAWKYQVIKVEGATECRDNQNCNADLYTTITSLLKKIVNWGQFAGNFWQISLDCIMKDRRWRSWKLCRRSEVTYAHAQYFKMADSSCVFTTYSCQHVTFVNEDHADATDLLHTRGPSSKMICLYSLSNELYTKLFEESNYIHVWISFKLAMVCYLHFPWLCAS